jgi:putative polymerase
MLSDVVLIVAVTFNAALAVVNAHVFALERTYVVLTEIAVYGAAAAIIFFRADRRMLPWALLALATVLLGFLLGLGNGAFNPKFPRDVLVIPVFVMLGMAHGRSSLVRPVLILQTIVFLIAVVEAVRPDLYAEIFQVLKYYVSTRDFSQNQFWNSESTLFISATRPGDRFFGFVEMHRLSSIFLEPVSLGNYCVVVAILLISLWKDFGFWTRAYLIATTLLLLVGCDGRLAGASILIILVLAPFFRWFPSRWSAIDLPLVLLASAAYVAIVQPTVGADNFGGRVAGSLDLLSQIDVAGFFGLDARLSDIAADSGISYFILTQSVIGLAAIWLCICLVPDGRDDRSRLYVHSIALFIPLNLMVSYSFFSIKVAALMWFCYGRICCNESIDEAIIGRTIIDRETARPWGARSFARYSVRNFQHLARE